MFFFFGSQPKSFRVSFPESIYLLHTQEPWCKYSTDHGRFLFHTFHCQTSVCGGWNISHRSPVGYSSTTLCVDPVPPSCMIVYWCVLCDCLVSHFCCAVLNSFNSFFVLVYYLCFSNKCARCISRPWQLGVFAVVKFRVQI